MRGLALLPLLATALLFGCAKDEDVEPAVVPKSVSFTGEPDPAYVGVWASADGGSVLDLGKDGTLKVRATANTPKGKATTESVGTWLLGEGELRLRYAETSGDQTTIAYPAKLSGDDLVLGGSAGRPKTVYRRK